MIAESLFIRLLRTIAIPAVLAILSVGCDYRGNLVDPDASTAPLFTLQGNIGTGFPDDLFGPSKSVRIGLIPLTGVYNSDAMRDPQTYRAYLSEPELVSADTVTVEYPAVSFTGEFPMNFDAEFRSLPDEKLINRYRGPSGTPYRLGVFAIGLFEDVDNDGGIRMSISMSGSGGALYAPGSDRLVGLCGDYFIIYLEDETLLTELNPYISEHLGASAVWEGLGAGFNLVALTETVSADSLRFTGVRAVPRATGMHIDPIDLTDSATGAAAPPQSMLAEYCIFHFQRDYGTVDFTQRIVKLPSGNETIYLKTWGDRHSVAVITEDDLPSESGVLGISLSATGVFDQGYYDCSNPMMSRFGFSPGEHFILNGHSCAADETEGAAPDTLDLDGDTLSAGVAFSGTTRCGGSCAPLYLDTLVVTIRIPENAPFTVVPVE